MTRPPLNQQGRPADDTALPRDARLAAALQHMPDANMTPSAAVRASVLREALEAAQQVGVRQPLTRAASWRRTLAGWWAFLSSGLVGPAAIASVFLATVVAGVVYQQAGGDGDPVKAVSAERARQLVKPEDPPSPSPLPLPPAEGVALAPGQGADPPTGDRLAVGKALPPVAAEGVASRGAAAGDARAVAKVKDKDTVEAKARTEPIASATPTATATANVEALAHADGAAPPDRAAEVLASAKRSEMAQASTERTQVESKQAVVAEASRDRMAAAPMAPAPTAAPALATLGANANSAPSGAVITLNGRAKPVSPARVEALLVALRQLRDTAPEAASRSDDAASGHAGAIELADGELWSWGAGRLRYRSAVDTAGAAAPIRELSPAQQARLNQLALQAMAP